MYNYTPNVYNYVIFLETSYDDPCNDLTMILVNLKYMYHDFCKDLLKR